MMDGLLYCMLYVQWGPTEYFGPRVPQSLNPTLPIASFASVFLVIVIHTVRMFHV